MALADQIGLTRTPAPESAPCGGPNGMTGRTRLAVVEVRQVKKQRCQALHLSDWPSSSDPEQGCGARKAELHGGYQQSQAQVGQAGLASILTRGTQPHPPSGRHTQFTCGAECSILEHTFSLRADQ
jgi:hypothetical protein